MNKFGPSGFRRNPFAVAMLMLSSVPLSALAQETAAQQPTTVADADATLSGVEVRADKINSNDYNDAVTTVGARTPTKIHDLPQQATVIDRAVIDAQGATSLNDVLRNVPGITLTSGEGSQIGNNINLRGFSARTDIYLDGFRDLGQYQRDIFSLDAVEVLEGPSSLLFGRGSTGGVINQVSKRPQLKPLGDVALTLGTDTFYRLTGDIGQPLSPDSAYRIALMAQDVDATRNSQITRKDYGIAPSLSFGMGTPTEVTLGIMAQHNQDIADYGFPMEQFAGQAETTPVAVPWGTYYGYSNNRYDQDADVFSLDIKHKFNDDVTLRSNTQYSRYRTSAAVTPLGSLVTENSAGIWSTVTANTLAPPTGATLGNYNIIAQMRDRTINDNTVDNQTDLLVKFNTGSWVHHLSTGFEIGRESYVNNYAGWYNFNYNDGSGLPGAGTSFAVFNLGQSNDMAIPTGPNIYRVPASVTSDVAGTASAYFNDQVDLNQQFKAVFGLRYDRFSGNQNTLTYCYTPATSSPATCPLAASYPGGYTTLNTSNTNPANTAAVQANNAAALQDPLMTYYQSQHNDYLFSTRDGVIWQPDRIQSYYAAYGTSFDPLLETVSGGLPTSAAAAAQYAQDGGYLPEKNISYEVGGKWDLPQGLSLSSALFEVEKTNARIQDPITLDYTLAGKERVRGGEIKFVGRLLPDWQVLGGYTYLSGKLISSPTAANDGLPLPNAPKNTASLWTTYDFLRHWEVGGGMTYSSNNPVTSVTGTSAIAVGQVVPGYTRADATVAYLTHHWNLRLNLLNLTDRDYFLAASGGRVTPADGRRLLFTATYNFF